MLTIQPVSANSYNRPAKVNFKGWEDDIDQGRQAIEDGQRALDGILGDDKVPQKLKKPVKFFKVLTNAALEGLAVFGSVMILADFFKKGKGSKVAGNFVEKMKPLAEKVAKGTKGVYEYVKAGAKKLAETNLGKKLVEKFNTFAATPKGKKVIEFAKKVFEKLCEVLDKAAKPFKNMDGDKVTKTTAATLGIGSGLTGAYEESMKNENITPDEEMEEGEI